MIQTQDNKQWESVNNGLDGWPWPYTNLSQFSKLELCSLDSLETPLLDGQTSQHGDYEEQTSQHGDDEVHAGYCDWIVQYLDQTLEILGTLCWGCCVSIGWIVWLVFVLVFISLFSRWLASSPFVAPSFARAVFKRDNYMLALLYGIQSLVIILAGAIFCVGPDAREGRIILMMCAVFILIPYLIVVWLITGGCAFNVWHWIQNCPSHESSLLGYSEYHLLMWAFYESLVITGLVICHFISEIPLLEQCIPDPDQDDHPDPEDPSEDPNK